MELEEAIKELQEKIKELDRHIKNYEKSDCKTNIYFQLVKEKQSIETVLQALKNSIPKKKIEDKIEELDNEFDDYRVDVNCTQNDYYIYSDEYAFVEQKLRELLE